MKRVNSESNAKQGLSIAESCASSTTVKQTLDITINGQAMHLTAEEMIATIKC